MKKELKKEVKRKFFRRKGKRKILILAAFSLLFSMAMPVYGVEEQKKVMKNSENSVDSGLNLAPKVVITDIYHKHIGSSNTLGGCYKLAIEHKHQGSASTGGGCYVKPVYHTHQGSEENGGGCYGKEVYHEHQGNAADGGGCFSEPIKHEHQNSCYEERVCTVTYTTVNVIDREMGGCFSGHGETAFVRAEGIGTHDSCGIGTENTIIKYCEQCGFMAPMMHDYQAVICGKNEDTVEGYNIGCGKTDTDIERYEPNCGHEEDEIEFYEIECDKVVDGYALACGLTEDVPCGRLIVTNETKDMAEQVTLCVKLEDLTGGKLELDNNPFVWQDKNGNQIGTGDKIQVEENGDYFVKVNMKNKDVDESGLMSKIQVDNIDKSAAKPTASATPSQSPEAAKTPVASSKPTDTPNAGSTENEEISQEDNKENELPDWKEDMIERREDVPVVLEQMQGNVEGGIKIAIEKKEDNSPSPSMTPSPKIVKETKKVVLPEKKAMEEIPYKVGQSERKNNIFANPVVRVITVAAGILILIVGILLWLFYLRNSVKVYNDDGEGRMIYLGRCIVRLEDDIYIIKITETMVEKAYTNRYCIKPGLFRLGREDEALVIYKESKNTTVYINKEVIAVL